MRTLRQQLERDKALARVIKKARTTVTDASGKHLIEKPTGKTIIYCKQCLGPVVDSAQARAVHAQQFPACKDAIEA